MSKKAGYGGAGGYGGISTLNQVDVRPRYAPHLAISKYRDYANDAWILKCVDCKQTWSHSVRAEPTAPEKCEKVRDYPQGSGKPQPYADRRFPSPRKD